MGKLRITDRNKDKFDKNGKKKKPNWEWRFEIRSGSNRKSFSKSGFRTKAEAQAAGTKALADFNSGIFTNNNYTVNELFDIYDEDYMKLNLRQSSRNMLLKVIDKRIRPELGFYKIKQITPETIQRFINNLKLEGYSRGYILTIKGALSAAFNYAIEKTWIVYNPVKVRIPKFENKKRERIVLSQEQIEIIFSKYPEGTKEHLPLMIGLYTGMRVSETFGLTWDRVDLEHGYIFVNRQMIRYTKEDGHEIKCLGDLKTEQSNRAVKIGNTLLELLKREKARQEENEKLLKGKYKHYKTIEKIDNSGEKIYIIVGTKKDGDTKFVCTFENGRFMNPFSLKTANKEISELIGHRFDFHTLRHTHATLLAESGANIKNLQSRLGHSNTSTTYEIYIHNTANMDSETSDLFEEIIAHKTRTNQEKI